MREGTSAFLLLAPTLLILIFLFGGGVLLGLMQSFNYMPVIGLVEPNLEAYSAMFRDEQFMASVLLTLWISFAATLLTLVFSILTALALRRGFSGKPAVTFFYQLPITIPHIVAAVGTLFLFSQSGLLARFAFHAGLIETQAQFPQLVNDRWGFGIIHVYLWKQIPFVGVIVLSILQSLGDDYEELARGLGAGRWQVFRHVLMPLIIPGILPAALICFAYTFGSFEVPFLLGRPYPAMLSVLAYRLYEHVDLNARPQAIAMAVLMALFLFGITLVYRRLLYRVPGRG
jgi:putative spermidine/putrescine transport system permease protein